MGFEVVAVVGSAIVVFSEFFVVSGFGVCSVVVCREYVDVGFNVVVVRSVVGFSCSVVAMEPALIINVKIECHRIKII